MRRQQQEEADFQAALTASLEDQHQQEPTGTQQTPPLSPLKADQLSMPTATAGAAGAFSHLFVVVSG